MEQKAKNVSPFSNESRNAYVVEHLTSSMFALLEEKPITEISISELCDMAGVGRTSFYRNYENKEDIVKKYIEHLFQDWLGKYKMAADLSIREKVRIVFAHFEANRDFYSLLNQRGLVYEGHSGGIDSLSSPIENPSKSGVSETIQKLRKHCY